MVPYLVPSTYSPSIGAPTLVFTSAYSMVDII